MTTNEDFHFINTFTIFFIDMIFFFRLGTFFNQSRFAKTWKRLLNIKEITDMRQSGHYNVVV